MGGKATCSGWGEGLGVAACIAMAGDGGMREDGGAGSACGDKVCGECLEGGCEAGMASSRGCMGFADNMGEVEASTAAWMGSGEGGGKEGEGWRREGRRKEERRRREGGMKEEGRRREEKGKGKEERGGTRRGLSARGDGEVKSWIVMDCALGRM